MDNTLRPFLKKIFGLAGWFLIATSLFNLSALIFGELTREPEYFVQNVNVLSEVLKVVDTVAGAFFCFLMRAVMHLLDTRDLGSLELTTRIFNVTLSAFLVQGIIPVFDISEIIHYQYAQACELGFCTSPFRDAVLLGKAMLPSITKSLTNFLFALSSYVLFRQLAQFVRFESEVA